MVDEERLHRVLRRITDDLATLEKYAEEGGDAVLTDAARLGHTKYLFICIVEGSIDAAQHVSASEGWGPPDTNADVFRLLDRHGVLTSETAETMAAAAGFRNLLVHRYAAIDDNLVVDHMTHLPAVRRYVAQMSKLLDSKRVDTDAD